MNQNNNFNQNNGFNQPINQANPQQNFQQPMGPQPVMNSQVNTIEPNIKNNKAKFYIIGGLLFIVGAVLGLFLGKMVYSKNNTTDNTNNNSNNNDVSDNNGEYPITITNDVIGDENGPFLMTLEDVFTLTGRGTVVTGKVLRGTVRSGDKIQVLGLNRETIEVEVDSIEAFRKNIEVGTPGIELGLLLKNINRDDVLKGQVLAKTNSVKTYKKCDVSVEMYSESDVGEKITINDTDKQLFHFWTADISGNISFSNGKKTLNSGQSSNATISLSADTVMEIGTKFYVKKGDKVVGKGTVTKLY